MEAGKKLHLLVSESNNQYELHVTQEIFDRASTDMTFATKLLQCCKNKGIKTFDAPLEDFDFYYGDTDDSNDISGLATGASFSNTSSTSSAKRPFRKKNAALSDSNDSDKKNEVYNWSKEDVLLLIAIYKEHQLLFLDNNFAKYDAWQKVVQDMTAERAKEGLPPIGEKKCKTKMDTLKRHYRSLKDNNSQKITWPFYYEMEDLFAVQQWDKPLFTTELNIPDEIEINPPSKRQKTLEDHCETLIEGRTSFTKSLSAGTSSFRKKHVASSDSNDSDQKCEVYNWSKDDVLLLIATYKQNQILFLDSNFSKNDAWQKVVQDMTVERVKEGLQPISEKKCRTKMDTLKRHYRILKETNNPIITWPFYEEMEELFGEQPYVKPLYTADVKPIYTDDVKPLFTAESNIPDEIEIKRPSKRPKTLKNFCERLIEGRKRRDEILNQQHQEKMAIANRLTDAVAQIAAYLIQKK